MPCSGATDAAIAVLSRPRQSPRERAKALSYCQPRRGGGVKVLLLLSHRESNKEVLPPCRGYGKMGLVRGLDDRKGG